MTSTLSKKFGRLAIKVRNVYINQHYINIKPYSFAATFYKTNNNEHFLKTYNVAPPKLNITYLPHDKHFSLSTSNRNSDKNIGKNKHDEDDEAKLSLFQKFKRMYRDYWYVLVPVHLVTSAAWFGGFYYMAKSGIDIVSLLESLHVSEKVIGPLRDSSMGYIAVAYALYKIATPARYTVTLGGTTVSINYLKKWGYIKPVPSKEQMKQMYIEKKETITKSMKETKEGIKEKKDDLLETIQEKTEDLKETKDTIMKTVAETKKTIETKKKKLKKKVSELKDKT